MWGLEYVPSIDGDDGAATTPYSIRSLPLYMMGTRTTTCVFNRNCIISMLRTILRLCKPQVCNLKIGTQFLDSENAQCNLEIAQIPSLHIYKQEWNGTGICVQYRLQRTNICVRNTDYNQPMLNFSSERV